MTPVLQSKPEKKTPSQNIKSADNNIIFTRENTVENRLHKHVLDKNHLEEVWSLNTEIYQKPTETHRPVPTLWLPAPTGTQTSEPKVTGLKMFTQV